MTTSNLPQPSVETVPAWWRSIVEMHGGREMIRYRGVSHSFSDLDLRAENLARGLLARGASKGSRIGLLAPNNPEWAIAWLAINRIGAIAVGVSTFYTARELHYALRHADVSILLTASRYLNHDYASRLEDALPGLAEVGETTILALPAAPYLRAIWFIDAVDKPWAAGTFADLEAEGASSDVYTADYLKSVEEVVSPADLGLMIYTSGSTAEPKGVVHTQAVTVRKLTYMAVGNAIIPANQHPGDRMLVTSPFFWVGGLLSLGGAMMHGSVTVCQDDHSPQALLDALRAEKLTHIAASEAVLLLMQELQPKDEDLMARLSYQNTTQRPFFSRLEGIPRERYPNAIGMTETFGPHSGYNYLQLLPAGAEGSLGPALDDVEYKITDPQTGETLPFGQPGELCVRTPWTMEGMYKRQRHEVFDKDGFYRTGDGCILREDGFLFFRTRLSGMIKTSGANVAPDEVEQVIREDPRVMETAVVGVSDEKIGQMVVAVIVPAPGVEISEAEVRARLRKSLSSFKTPKRVFFLRYEDIPRTLSNKVRKPQLTELVAGMIEAELEVSTK